MAAANQSKQSYALSGGLDGAMPLESDAIENSVEQTWFSPRIDRKTLRLSAMLLVVGFIFYVVVGLLHAGGPANNHPVVFAIYASSAIWTAVHLGQFVGMAVIIAGLLVLYFALDLGCPVLATSCRAGCSVPRASREPTNLQSLPAMSSSWPGSFGLLWSPGGRRNRPERPMRSNRPAVRLNQ